MAKQRQRTIDETYNALRPRLRNLAHGTSAVSVVVAPHTHAASEITNDPDAAVGGLISAFDVQTALDELDSEKLARDGTQPMLGNLDMNHHDIANAGTVEVEGDINLTGLSGNIVTSGDVGAALLQGFRWILMVGIGLISGLKKLDFSVSGVGDGIIDQPRVIHMAGDHADDEAKIDGLERVVFNDEVTASKIEMPSAIQFNPAVAPGSDTTFLDGQTGWSNKESVLVADVTAAPQTDEIRIALGWTVFACWDGQSE